MSEEIRRPSDTYRMSREDIEAALSPERRETLPLGVQEAIADAQGLDAVPCPLCAQGLVTADAAARARRALDGEAPITSVDDVVTQPVGPRGR